MGASEFSLDSQFKEGFGMTLVSPLVGHKY